MKVVCVFASAEEGVSLKYGEAAERLGKALVKQSLTLLYGGGKSGLMGILARTVLKEGGTIISVIPGEVKHKDLWFDGASEVVNVQSIVERRTAMVGRADGFIALPGGLGTVNEISEAQLGCQLGFYCKPVVYLNWNGFYSTLESFYSRLFDEGFVDNQYRDIFKFIHAPEEAVEWLVNFTSQPIVGKWS